MRKYTQFLPLALLCLYFVKVSLQPIGYPEASILLILASLTGYLEYKNNDKKLNELEQKVNEVTKLMTEKANDIDNLKISVASSKLVSTFQNGNLNARR